MRLTHYLFFVLITSVLFMGCEVESPNLSHLRTTTFDSASAYSTLNLMPVPASVKKIEGRFRLTNQFTLAITPAFSEARLYNASNSFLRRLDGRTGLFFPQGVISKEIPQTPSAPSLTIAVERPGKVELYEDESYAISITNSAIKLTAVTDIGALRGLETLLQLLDVDGNGYYFPCIEIKDAPRFPWRGLMIDAARHFMPVDVLKRNIDAMAAVKMNVLHFHLCDNQGWRVESKSYPKLHQLASDGQYYTQLQLKEIIEYAAERGIRVMPEFDVPGHATAILVAYPELGSAPGPYEMERNAGIFDPVLDPTNEQTYVFLDRLFTEMMAIFPDPYFHIGGDENNGNHWKANPKIQTFMAKNNMKTTLDLQTYFNNRLIKTIQRQNKKMMGWEEILSDNLSKDAIIHSWFGKESLYRAASKGYQTLLSNGYYIDLLHPAADHYVADPLPPFEEWSEEEKKYKLTPEQEKLILGGEATMWAELVTPTTVDSRIWPRTAAIAERLWSPREVKDIDDMYRRLEVTSFRLEELGLTHIKNKDVILRNLANGQDIAPLKVLAEAIEPYKVYRRNNGGLMYKSYSPFTLMADATSSDAKSARLFNSLVKRYTAKPEKADLAEIRYQLTVWKENHEAFLSIAKNSPVLKQLEGLSATLSELATIGLDAVSTSSTSKKSYQEKSEYIKAVKDSSAAKSASDKTFEDGRCEIMIVDAIQALLDMTNRDMANERIAAEKAEAEKNKTQTSGH